MQRSTSTTLPTLSAISKRTYQSFEFRTVQTEANQLTKDVNNFLEKTRMIDDGVYKMLINAARHYSVSFHFNELMLLRMYVDATEFFTLETSLLEMANREWTCLGYRLVVNCRILCHLTANCPISEDVVVYRGFQDRRKDNVQSFEKEKQKLMHIREIRELEKQIRESLKEPFLLYQVIARRKIERSEMKKGYTEQELETAQQTILMVVELNERIQSYQSRDVQSLLENTGDLVQLDTFLSTSLNIETAKNFMGDKHCCLLEIMVPAGTTAFYLSAHSSVGGEFELVLPPCSKLLVTGKSKGITRARYMGIPDVARKRLTLDNSRLYIFKTLLEKLKAKEVLERKVKLEQLRCAKAEFLLTQNEPFFGLCRETMGWVKPNERNLATYSNSQLTDTWTDDDKYEADLIISNILTSE
ncbi:MAG: ADP-ribosyltransferase [Bacteroidota bacterium]